MSELAVYAVMLRLDPESTQQVVEVRKSLLDQETHSSMLVPPQILMKGPFRACVPCGALIQRLELGLKDFDPVELHLSDLRWLQGTQLHWDAMRLPDGTQNFELLHLKTQLWTVSNSLVSIHCEFTPSEPFSFRTINPWQPGVVLVKRQRPSEQETLPHLSPRHATGQVLDLFRLHLQGGIPHRYEHVASFAGRTAGWIMR